MRMSLWPWLVFGMLAATAELVRMDAAAGPAAGTSAQPAPVVLMEFPTVVGGAVGMPMPGKVEASGATWGFYVFPTAITEPDGTKKTVQLAQDMVEHVAGPLDPATGLREHAVRLAGQLSVLPEGSRWICTGGWFGVVLSEGDQATKAASVDTLACYRAACERIGVTIDGLWVDFEGAGAGTDAKARWFREVLYDSGLFDPKVTRCAVWGGIDGLGPMKTEWGPVNKSLPVDGGTTVVHAFLRWGNADKMLEDAAEAEKQIIAAKKLGLDVAVVITGAWVGQGPDASGRPHLYTADERAAWRVMVDGVRRHTGGRDVWIVHNREGRGLLSYPLANASENGLDFGAQVRGDVETVRAIRGED